MKSIISEYLEWHFFDEIKVIINGWKNCLEFGLDCFSVPLLIKTFCSPWRRYRYSYPKSFDIRKIVDAFTFNAISRFIGMIMRIILIIFGIIAEIFIFLAGLIFLILWIFYPILLILLLFYGIKLLF